MKGKRLSVLIPERMHQQLTAIAEKEGSSVSNLVRDAIQQEISWRAKEELEQAADKLALLYASDPELTAFTSLDGEGPLENLHGMLSGESSLTGDLMSERSRDLEKEEAIGKKGAADD